MKRNNQKTSNTFFIQFPFKHGLKCLNVRDDGVSQQVVRDAVSSHLSGFRECNDFVLYVNGKELSIEQKVYQNQTVLVSFRLPGGKGGFGSMLRAIGAQIEKTTNREACRDLSGRRLRDINEEQRLKKWIAKKAEREAEKIKRRKERIERLKSRPKHNFVDFEYEKEISNLPERVDEALSAGLLKVKRPLEANEPSTSSTKKKHLWLDEEISESSDSDLERTSSDHVKESSDLQCHKSLCEHCSTSISKPENLSSISSDESSVKNCGDENNSTLGVSSNDEQKIILQSNTFSEDDRSNSQLKNGPVEIPCESNQPPTVKENLPQTDENIPVDLDEFSSAVELEALGLQRLKSALMERGLKCGGNIVDRSQRLWAVHGLQREEYPKNLLAKSKK